jgi:hypothetical protein
MVFAGEARLEEACPRLLSMVFWWRRLVGEGLSKALVHGF